MASATSSLVVTLGLLSILCSVSGETIEQMCGKTDKPELCTAIVTKDPKHDTIRSPLEMVEVLLHAGHQKGKDAWAFMDKNFNADDSELQHAFDQCTQTIVEQQLNFQPEIKEIGSKPQNVVAWLEATQDVTSTYCKMYKPDPMPPVLTTVFQKVDDYVFTLNIAAQILKANH